MAIRNYIGPIKGVPSGVLAAVRFVPGATPTVQEGWNCTVARTPAGAGAGDYTVTLKGKAKGVIAQVEAQENDTTTYHFCRVESQDDAAGTIKISHKSVAYASVAAGPALSDTVDSITVLIYARGE